MLEESLRSHYKYGYWMIFRIPMIQQFFYFWSKMIEDKSVIGMPISEANMLETVNIQDVCACLSQSVLSKKSLVWRNQSLGYSIDGTEASNSGEQEDLHRASLSKRVYELTSTMPMNPLMIADAITAALKKEGFESTIEPAVITDEELKEYLQKIAHEENNNKALLSTSVSNREESGSLFAGDTVSVRFNCHGEPDCPKMYPHPSKFLSPFAIQLIIDCFRYTRSPSTIISPANDVRDITGCDPVELDEFFMKNRSYLR